MFSMRIFLFILFFQWIFLCTAFASDSKIENGDGESDIQYRCDRSILALPPGGIGGLFSLVTIAPDILDKTEVINARQELCDLWGSKVIESKSWFFPKSSMESSIMPNFFLNNTPECSCVKVWSCVRKFQEVDYLVGSVWFFWSDIAISSPLASRVKSEISGWCDQFSLIDELASREIILVAHDNSVFLANIVSKWFIDRNKEKNLKVVFFNPPAALLKDLVVLPRKGLLIGFSNNEESEHNMVITGSPKSKQEVMDLYEAEKASIMSSLSVPEDTSQSSTVYNLVPHFLTFGIAAAAAIYLYLPSVRNQFESFSSSFWHSYRNDHK